MYHSSVGKLPFLIGGDWEFVPGLVWEVLTLCLAIWIAIKHFHQLRRQSTGWTVRDCFTILIRTHVLYFAAFAVASCFALGNLSPSMSNDDLFVGVQVYNGVYQIALNMQLFVLGPHLILSVRAYHAQLLANCDEGTVTTTIVSKSVHTSGEVQHRGVLQVLSGVFW
ncbi:hypothetical protein BDR03DRAFT_661994 [Suillus americanus]|nr:hypothetical protein BDR03DRAFT_661994 [Suillus americanus]